MHYLVSCAFSMQPIVFLLVIHGIIVWNKASYVQLFLK